MLCFSEFLGIFYLQSWQTKQLCHCGYSSKWQNQTVHADQTHRKCFIEKSEGIETKNGGAERACW